MDIRRHAFDPARSDLPFAGLRTLLAILAIALLGASSASAQGYIEINQAIVDAAGGFPFTISAPGSYRFTGNVTKSSGTSAAIVIDSPDVILDLAGFTLSGPGICSRNASTGAITCSGHVPGSGIQDNAGNTNIEIRNGTVKGFFNGVSLTGAGNVVRDLTVYDNAFGGVSLIGDASQVRSVTALRNGSTGITVQNNSTVQNCEASQNDDYGIIANLASAIVFSSTMGNRLGGMSLNSQATFSGNNVQDNFGPDPVFSGIDGGGNVCTNAVGTPVGC